MKLIFQILIFVVLVTCYSEGKQNFKLCETKWNLNSTSIPEIVLMITEPKLSQNPYMKEAIDDTVCWIKTRFSKISAIHHINDDDICYHFASVPLKPRQLLVAVIDGNLTKECPKLITGPVPNLLVVENHLDGSSTILGLKFVNAGGVFRLTFDLNAQETPRIQKTLDFMLELNLKSVNYGTIIGWWWPPFDLPPDEYFQRFLKEISSQAIKENYSISPLLVASCMPMIIFSIVVSCYLVIQPTGGLVYTDEEVDFVIEEVASSNKLNIMVKQVLPTEEINYRHFEEQSIKTDKTLGSMNSEEVEENKTMESVKHY